MSALLVWGKARSWCQTPARTAEVKDAECAKVKNTISRFDAQNRHVRGMPPRWDHSDTGVIRIMGTGVQYNDGKVKGTIHGGSYLHAPAHLPGVNLAYELRDKPSDVVIPIRDFSVPDVDDMLRGMWAARYLLAKHGAIYAGCYGGNGRTGLFMAAMLMWAERTRVWNSPRQAALARKAIVTVRREYRPHAVETLEQQQFLEDLPLSFSAWKAWALPVF